MRNGNEGKTLELTQLKTQVTQKFRRRTTLASMFAFGVNIVFKPKSTRSTCSIKLTSKSSFISILRLIASYQLSTVSFQ